MIIPKQILKFFPVCALLFSSLLLPKVGWADEIGFVERFALAKDREAVLKELVPGTEDYFYFHCLHYQNTEAYDLVDGMTKRWVAKFGYTARATEILNRQALLTYDRDNKKSIDYLIKQLSVNLNHQRDNFSGPTLASVLDSKLISRSTLTARALAQYSNTDGFEQRALDWLMDTKLEMVDLRHLLQRIAVPDHPKLVELITKELKDRSSPGFGSMTIHRNLTLDQLDLLEKEIPNILNQSNFVNIYLGKIRPDSDVNFDKNDEAKKKHLERLWSFVKRLAPVHNSLKANILFHRLAFDRRQGDFDRDRFMEYIKLPRNAVYANPDYLKLEENRRYPCNLNANYQGQTLLPPVRDDRQLVSDYLQHFFKTDQSFKAFEPYLNNSFLKREFAESKIVNGLGDPEQWASYLTASEYQEIRERVDLEFTHANRQDYRPDDEVTLELYVKNVPKLIVKVFEINTQNYYRDQQSEIDTTIELDGLLPNSEKAHEYEVSPFLRRKIKFSFPELNKRGVYVIDFIGNRKSSRALIRKGRLRFIEEVTAAGQELQVVNENNQVVKNASLWLQGRQIKADKEGKLLVPFSGRPGTFPVVLSDGAIHSLDYLNHRAESYSLDGGFFVDRESLVGGQLAKLVLRTELRINGRRTSHELLTKVRLILTSTDFDGTVSTKEVKDFDVKLDQESTYEFKVPLRLQKLRAQLVAEVKNLSQSRTETLSVADEFLVNKIETEAKVEDLYLTQVDGDFFVDLLGKNGELKVARPVNFELKHRDFKNSVGVSLQTDMRGRIRLGGLDHISLIKATGPEGTSRTWNLPTDRNRSLAVNVKVGQSFQVPITGVGKSLTRRDVSLFSLVNNRSTIEKDFFGNVKYRNGNVEVSGLAPGDYVLRLKEQGRAIDISVVAGDSVGSQVIGARRLTLQDYRSPIQVTRIQQTEKETIVHVTGASDMTRIHLVATRYQPRFDMMDLLGTGLVNRGPSLLPQSSSLYVDGRKIGDEYQYILDRKYAEKYPGLMLKRPGLLLQPWAVRSTQTSKQEAQAGGKFEPADDSRTRGGENAKSESRTSAGNVDESTMEFLREGSVVLANLAVKDNKVTIDNQLLKGNQQLHVLAINGDSTAYHSQSFKESELAPESRVFVSNLDANEKYARKKEISFVDKGANFTVTDIRSGKFEIFDNLPAVYRLYQSVNADPKLAEFRFILRWKGMKDAEKLELYSKYACHELNFFLSKKDPDFFRAIVVPYLKNKKDKTFLDDYLVGNDLTHYRKPWAFAQLNTVERILLANAIREERTSVVRYTQDAYDNQPTPQARYASLFEYALSRSALDTTDTTVLAGLGAIRQELRDKDFESLKLSAAEPMSDQKSGGAVANSGEARFGRSLSRDANENANGKSNGDRNKWAAKAESERDGLAIDSLQVEKARESAESMRYRGLALKRKAIEQLFKQIDKTMEWAENNYYHLPIGNQNADLVTVNQFWNDFAAHDPAEPFFSSNFAEASRNFTEMMFALSVLDLDWESADHDSKVDKSQIVLTAKSPLLIFHEQIRPAIDGRKGTTVLVSQNFFRIGDRYQYEGPDRLDKFVTDEFVKQIPYGCQIVVTNPTSSKQKIDLLLQIPQGSLPLSKTLETRSLHLELDPYKTSSVEYFFYFPESGQFAHYPVHVAKNEEVIAFAENQKFNVVNEPSKIDRTSWAYISQQGTTEEVLRYLDNNNLQRISLDRIAWRLKDREVFEKVISKLAGFHIFNPTLWGYAFMHNQPGAMAEFIEFRNDFVNATGAYLNSKLLHNDRVARKTYEHLEYDPLVNARVHQLGANRKILNDRFHSQYHRFLEILACKSRFESQDHLALTYYLLLQERFAEAQQTFANATAGSLQYDYMAAYLDMLDNDTALARRIASRYQDYPVERWQSAFRTMLSQLNEIDGGPAKLVDNDNRSDVQSQLASKSSSFDFAVDSQEVKLNYANLEKVSVNYYVMDVELLFSRNPFVQNVSGELTYIRPRQTQEIQLPKKESSHQWKLPVELSKSNVLVEIVGEGQTRSKAYYAHALSVQFMENYGQLKVRKQNSGGPMPKTYCKVYAQMKDGKVRFYKDGYTDLRGRFDYASLSTNDLDNVSKFSVLVMSDDLGATVSEILPPKR